MGEFAAQARGAMRRHLGIVQMAISARKIPVLLSDMITYVQAATIAAKMLVQVNQHRMLVHTVSIALQGLGAMSITLQHKSLETHPQDAQQVLEIMAN